MLSGLEQMIAMMDPGVYEDRKQTLGDVGPWPGRMDDAYLTEKAEMDKLMPGLQYAMAGSGGIGNLIISALRPSQIVAPIGNRDFDRPGAFVPNKENKRTPQGQIGADFLNGVKSLFLKGEGAKTEVHATSKLFDKAIGGGAGLSSMEDYISAARQFAFRNAGTPHPLEDLFEQRPTFRGYIHPEPIRRMQNERSLDAIRFLMGYRGPDTK